MMLHVRNNIKTGKRTVPAGCGDVIEKIQDNLCSNKDPDALLFQDPDGTPVDLQTLHHDFNEVCSRIEGWDRSPDLYEMRHLYITRGLKEGVPVTTVATTVGSSENLITTTYAHILMTSEETARSLYEQQVKGTLGG